MQQRSEEWYQARLGVVTASRVADIMATTKTGEAASYKNYMMQLLCERLTGNVENGYVSEAMQRGIDLEPAARIFYEIHTGNNVTEVGFIKHKSINMGASPDGLIGTDGLIEIKCPNTAQHIEVLESGAVPKKYIWQMMAQMECTGRQWCDFVSFDDRLNEEYQLFVKNIERDEKLIQEMLSKVSVFNEKLDELTLKYQKKAA